MRNLYWVAFVFLVFAGTIFSQERKTVADLPVSAINIQKSNVLLALSEIAYKHNVPIGLEVSPDDDLLKDRHIVVRIDNGTLKDVLDSIVSQNPLYTWGIQDDVVNVFPKGHREPVIETLLQTRIEKFSIPKGTSRFTMKETLTSTAELRGVLVAFGVTPNKEIFASHDMAPLGKEFSLEVCDATVRSILNAVINKSQTKYWIINLEGTRKNSLLLNL